MTVILRTSKDLPQPSTYNLWFAITGGEGKGPANKKLPDLATRLEDSFDTIIPMWWDLGQEMSRGPGAELAYATTCATFGSDFGLMMAWSHLVSTVAEERKRCLVICDDPWIYRLLATKRRVVVGTPPRLGMTKLKLRFRGFFARLRLIYRLAWARLILGGQRKHHGAGDPALLVYGHPRSTADGYDAYFGPMMTELPELKRLLHTDCPVGRARELAADGRTASLHAWGRLSDLPGLLNVRWRPEQRHLTGLWGWLVRRAEVREGSGAAHATNTWQRQCQERWLDQVKPRAVAWPWENHGWERGFCRAARKRGVFTIGYQHTVIGPHQLNYSPFTNMDGAGSLPDRVVCSGSAYKDQLSDWGFPKERLGIAGSLRIQGTDSGIYHPDGPVFVALSARHSIARQQIAAVQLAVKNGFRFLIKDHPMYPLNFQETENIARTEHTIPEQTSLSAVVYSTGTSGLEAVLAGLPTIRLLPDDEIAIDILPSFVSVPACTAEDLADALVAPAPPPPLDPDKVISSVDITLWRKLLMTGAW